MSDSKEGGPTPNPPQTQQMPGSQAEMRPQPKNVPDGYRAAGKLAGKRAIITGADSGIGRAVAVLFAMEGADVAAMYLKADADAAETKRLVEAEGRKCLLIAGDVGDEAFAKQAVEKAKTELGGIDILVNNAAWQHPEQDFLELDAAQVEKTFRTNILGYFNMARAALPHLGEGGSILNTCSVLAFKGSGSLIDYSSTKGAIVSFTRALSQNEGVRERKIRVNSVAPGPVWTPLIPASFPADKVAAFGNDTHLKRPAQPGEIATSFVFLASADGIFFTGQTLHPNGGTVVGA